MPWNRTSPVKALDGTDGYGAKAVFERVFREAGLPKGMLTASGRSYRIRNRFSGVNTRQNEQPAGVASTFFRERR